MAPRYYKAFTLVEVLVVIVIISMLVLALLAGHRRRSSTCPGKLSEQSKPGRQGDSPTRIGQRTFPGYVDQLGKDDNNQAGARSKRVSGQPGQSELGRRDFGAARARRFVERVARQDRVPPSDRFVEGGLPKRPAEGRPRWHSALSSTAGSAISASMRRRTPHNPSLDI